MRRLLLAVLLVACSTDDQPATVPAAGPSAAPRAEPTVAEPFEPARFVDPFIGTGGHGHTYPGATVPFGMVQLSPDTRLTGWDGCSGYHFSDEAIHGFSHTHLSGTGVADYCDVLVVPLVGGATSRPIRFDKATERASPGDYRVVLGNGVEVELTATARAGLHRYRFPADREARLVVDLAHRDRVTAAHLEVVGDGQDEIAGERRSSSWARDQRLYFAMRFSRPFDIWAGRDREGEALFAPSAEPLLVKVGLSATSIAAARANLEAELPGWDFDAVRERAHATWNAALGKIRIEGGTDRQRRIFYTALYHCFLAPNLFSDVDGRYRGHDGEVHESRGHDVYTVFSLWDTFRALHPLLAIVDRSRTKDFLRTFLAHFEDGGRLPVWELAGNETDCMIGYHAVPVILDAWVAGILDRNRELAHALYEASKHFAMLDQRGQDAYKQLGFIPSEHDGESVSKTLEYAYDDWCIAQMAARLLQADDYEYFLRRAQAYVHLFDPDTGFLRPKRNHAWKTPFDPREVDFNFTEANCWQYTFFVPHDVEGLVALLGGREAFAAKLDALFEAPPETTGREQSDITGLIGQYAHGNEPSHHMAYLYNHAGQPWKAQRRVRQILDELYADEPDGLCGNEDCGQMSAWYVLSALGLYPVCPGSGHFELGSPLFAKATLQLENGEAFVIRADGASRARGYVQSATLNGEPWRRSWIPSEAVHAGGELRFELGPEPNEEWGSGDGDRPRTAIDAPRVLPVPFVVAGDRAFFGATAVELRSIESGAEIRYTLDGSEPTAASPVYGEPITLADTTTLKAFARKDGFADTPVVTARFYEIPNDWSVRIAEPYSNQYTAGGDHALIDGLRGTTSWRTGSWQGYRGDFDATVDLGAPRRLSRIAAGFLQDTRSWIWMPRHVVFEVSTDGEEFRQVGRIVPDIADSEPLVVEDYEVALRDVEARYVRVRAKNHGRTPDNEVGRGGRAWIFVDEILIEARRGD